jgi:hypothetical protein
MFQDHILRSLEDIMDEKFQTIQKAGAKCDNEVNLQVASFIFAELISVEELILFFTPNIHICYCFWIAHLQY